MGSVKIREMSSITNESSEETLLEDLANVCFRIPSVLKEPG